MGRADRQGLWTDSQIAPLKRQVDYVHAHQGTIGIQLAHAGRKASTLAPWVERLAREDGWTGGAVPDNANNGWVEDGTFHLVLSLYTQDGRLTHSRRRVRDHV